MLIYNRIRNEPALVSGFVVALLTLLAAFGLDLTAEQTAAITTVTGAVLAFVVRSQVTPTRKADKFDGVSLRDEFGSISLGDAVVLVFLGVILLVILGYVGR